MYKIILKSICSFNCIIFYRPKEKSLPKSIDEMPKYEETKTKVGVKHYFKT